MTPFYMVVVLNTRVLAEMRRNIADCEWYQF